MNEVWKRISSELYYQTKDTWLMNIITTSQIYEMYSDYLNVTVMGRNCSYTVLK